MKRPGPLTFPAQTPVVCVLPVIDVAFGAVPRQCGEPATTTRKIGGVDLPACDRCAAALDAIGNDHGEDGGRWTVTTSIPLDLARVVEARSYPRAPGERRKKRVVTRFSGADVARLDALRRSLPIRLTRAQMVRACAFYVLAAAEQEGAAS